MHSLVLCELVACHLYEVCKLVVVLSELLLLKNYHDLQGDGGKMDSKQLASFAQLLQLLLVTLPTFSSITRTLHFSWKAFNGENINIFLHYIANSYLI